jgi:hypothetical protein
LPAGLEFIQPSECRDHALTHLISGTVAFDDLQVDASLRLLAAEVHVRIGVWVRTAPKICMPSIKNIILAWHYIFIENASHGK